VRLAVPGPLRHVNCWLLEDQDERGPGYALVDTGMNRTETRDAWRAVFRGPLAGARITRVIATHMHPDHVGLAGWMCAYHDAALLMTRTEWLTAKLALADARDDVPADVVSWWRMAGWDETQVAHAAARGWRGFGRIVHPLPHAYRRMREGERLAIGGREWHVMTGAGHSPEHAALFDAENGVLIAGDQLLPRISSNVSMSHSEPLGDPLGEWLDNLARLRDLPADTLVLPGHGDPFTGAADRADAIVGEHRARLDTLAARLADGPIRAVDAFPLLFARSIGPDVLWMATGEALAHFRRLEVEGRAAAETVDGVRRWRAAG